MAVETLVRTPEEKRARKQERAKARRKANNRDKAITALYKPLEEWDEEELARGQPRNIEGHFGGPVPKWVSRQVHEEAVKRFKDNATAELRGLVPLALQTVTRLIMDDRVDDRGRPVVPRSVQLDAAKWVVEHLVGKPTQRIEADISVRLQAILGNALVIPDASGELGPAVMEADSWEDDGEDEPGGRD